jgi:transcriptional regulator with XRE-family HTH domain
MRNRALAGRPRLRERRPFQRFARVLGERIRRLRMARGWTQRCAASQIGIGPAGIRRMETGSANPSLAVLVSVARAFGVSLNSLLEP